MSTVTISESQEGKTVVAAPGDAISIRLPENPTTGFRWHVATPPRFLSIEKDWFEPAADAQIGGAGTHVFLYRSIGSGSDPLRLVLRREWEPEESVIRQFQVTVAVGS